LEDLLDYALNVSRLKLVSSELHRVVESLDLNGLSQRELELLEETIGVFLVAVLQSRFLPSTDTGAAEYGLRTTRGRRPELVANVHWTCMPNRANPAAMRKFVGRF
jgi:hypothetical protein